MHVHTGQTPESRTYSATASWRTEKSPAARYACALYLYRGAGFLCLGPRYGHFVMGTPSGILKGGGHDWLWCTSRPPARASVGRGVLAGKQRPETRVGSIPV
jgi:hypothetical protein